MAHFAKLDDNNTVMRVEVIDNSVLLDSNNVEQEQLGIEFLKSLYGPNSRWVQTSYNNTFRGKFAGIGDIYNAEYDTFGPPKPYPSWIFNQQLLTWQAPIPYPDTPNNEIYSWNEQTLSWEFVGIEEVIDQPPA